MNLICQVNKDPKSVFSRMALILYVFFFLFLSHLKLNEIGKDCAKLGGELSKNSHVWLSEKVTTCSSIYFPSYLGRFPNA